MTLNLFLLIFSHGVTPAPITLNACEQYSELH